MSRQATKKKRDKKRALKRKHEHQTEHMQAEAAKHRRTKREEIVVLIVIVALLPFLLTGFFLWPSDAGNKANTGLEDGSYVATCAGARAASGADAAAVALEVEGTTYIVNASDLSGRAARDPEALFDLKPGDKITITVKDGYITEVE